MKKCVYILIAFILIACSARKDEDKLFGKCKTPLWGCTQLLLKSDKTFEYWIFEDVGGENLIKGTWEKYNGDTIKLNSYNQPEKDDVLAKLNLKFIINELVIVKNNKVVIFKNNGRRFSLKKNYMKNKMWK
jgi:hypothetical protein